MDNVHIITELYEAGNRRDLETLARLYAPDIEVVQTELLPWGGHYQGQPGLMTFFQKLLGYIDSQVEVQEFVSAGENVVAIGRTRGTVNANGNRFDVRFVHVWTVRDGQAQRFEAYVDTPEFLRVLGAAPE